jgi:CheY-like chemotaxis protein
MVSKILMVDDDADFLDACRNVLEAAGYEVECETVEELVLDRARRFGPDLVILDVLMSRETSGFDLADHMQDEPALATVPIVFLTGYFRRKGLTESEADVIRRWKNVRQVLDKPVKPSVLLEAIRKV